jgi:arginase
LTDRFLQSFPGAAVTPFHFSLPEYVTANDYYSLLTREFKQAISLINRSLQPNQRQVVIGGDHSVAFASVAAVLQRFQPGRVGVVLFDSHGDLNTISTSLSGNFHGMWLRAVVERFDEPELDRLVSTKLPLANLGLVGNMLLDPAEVDFIRQRSIRRFADPAELQAWLQQFDHIHLSFDVDVFNQSLVPATGTPNPDGYSRDQVFQLLAAFQQLPSLSLDLVEVNPLKPGADRTTTLAQQVLEYLLIS